MNKKLFKSIGAILAGFVSVFALSYGTDAVLVAAGLMPEGALPIYGSELLILSILVYRSLYNVAGSYLVARLAPDQPMRHVLILGALGLLGSIAGAIFARDLAPAWYSWGLVALTPPCVWIGGKLALRSKKAALAQVSPLANPE